MHDLTMPQWAIDRVKERRTKLHVYDDLDPRKTALIVVDLQVPFMDVIHERDRVLRRSCFLIEVARAALLHAAP